MKKLFISLLGLEMFLRVAVQAAGGCDRTSQVQKELATKLNKACEQITDTDLLAHQTDLSIRESKAEPGHSRV